MGINLSDFLKDTAYQDPNAGKFVSTLPSTDTPYHRKLGTVNPFGELPKGTGTVSGQSLMDTLKSLEVPIGIISKVLPDVSGDYSPENLQYIMVLKDYQY